MDENMGMPPVEEPKKNNRTLIIVIVVLAVLCCCCVAIGVLGWNFGDQIMYELGIY
jgi:flagellar basal body-associated protein FliL